MRGFFARRWPWIVSTLVHGAGIAALVFPLSDANSRAAVVAIPVELVFAPEPGPPAMPQSRETGEAAPEEHSEPMPEAALAVDPIPPAEPMPKPAEIRKALAVPSSPALPKPKPPAPVLAKAAPGPSIEDPVPAAPTARPATPTAPQVAAPSQPEARPGADTAYYGLILGWLEKHKSYPRQAQARRQQGTAILRFELDRQGRVLSYRITSSSGVAELDREVEAMIRRAEPLPPMPADLTQATLELQVPVQFRLR